MAALATRGSGVNADEVVRLRLQSLVARGLAAPEVARRVGLAAASEVWGGDVPRDRPAWYLWLAGAAGAWQVELSAAGPLEGVAGAVVGRLTVRHYPSPADPILSRFDPDERRAVAEALDATGTPRIDVASAIPDALFTVGAVDWAIDVERDGSVFVLASLDRLRTREGSRVRRDVPGWRLAAPVFSALAGLHAQLDRRAATRLVVARQPGFELVRDDAGVAPRDAEDVVQGEALLAFRAANGCGDPAGRLLEALREEGTDVLADERLGAGARGGVDAFGADARLALAVSPAWFGGEAHFEGIACAC
jgi:hypothetical protein